MRLLIRYLIMANITSLSHQPEAEEECGGGHEGGGHVGHVVLQERHLDQVLGHGVLQHVHVARLGVAAQEVERERPREVEAEGVEHAQLHLADLGGGVRVVRDVHEVVDLRRVHLLHLARDEHSAHAHQLQFVPPDGESFHLGNILI